MLRGMKGSITKQLVYKTWVAVYDAYKLQELCMVITYFGLVSAHSHNTIKKLLISCTFYFCFWALLRYYYTTSCHYSWKHKFVRGGTWLDILQAIVSSHLVPLCTYLTCLTSPIAANIRCYDLRYMLQLIVGFSSFQFIITII